jgi:integrase
MIRLGWSRNYINDSVGRIKRLFRWAKEEELIPAAVADAVSGVGGLKKDRSEARERPKVEPVPDEAVDAVLPVLPPIVADMVRIQRLTGHRPGELLAMAVDEVDRGDSSVWVHRPAHHKTEHQGKDRVVFIGPRARTILAPYILAAGAGRIFHHTRDGYREVIARACDRAFPHPTLSGMPKRRLTEAQAAELKAWRKAHRWHPNQLRHSAATGIRDRFGLDSAQVVLGHSHASTTEIYARVNAEKAREVAKAMG